MPDILYLDKQILIALKPVNVISEDDGTDRCMPGLLRTGLRVRGEPESVYGVHRLDKNVSGLMLFSRRSEVTGKLIVAVSERRITKEYYAVLRGHPAEPEATLKDLLFHDSARNKTYVVTRPRKGVRDAELSYRVLEETPELTLVRIRLHTGRTHQIRAQFSSRGLSLLGDIRYGSKDPNCTCALFACHLSLKHPVTGKTVSVSALPPEQYPWNLFPSLYSNTELGQPE